MNRRTHPILRVVALVAAVLATGLAGCKKAPQGGSAPTQTTPPAQAQGQTPAPGLSGQARPEGTAKLAGLPSGMPPAAAATPVDPAKLPAVVAKINGVEIKKAQLVAEAAQLRQQLAQAQGIQAPLNSEFYKQVLDGIVARTLLTQEAKAQNVTVSDAEVEQQMAQIRSRTANPKAFQDALAANGMTEATLRQRIKSEGSVAPFDMVKGQIEEFLKQKQSQQVLAAHVQELRTKGKVETFL